MSHTAQQAFPVIKVSNLFDGKPNTKLFTRNVDYRITTKAEIGTFENFLDRLQFWYPKQDYPFDRDASSNPKFPSNFDYVEKTGLGQLDTLFKNVNRNLYKQRDNYFYSAAERAGTEIQDRSTLIGNFLMPNKKFYDANNATFNPYIVRDPAIDKSIEDANASMVDAYVTTTQDDNVKQEYAPNADFVGNNMGQTKKVGTENDASQLGNAADIDMNNWVDPYTEFKADILENKIVWGRDGISDKVEANLVQLRGDSDEEIINSLAQDLKTNFNVRTGLLEYTRNLINASEGQIGDVTRKAFTKKGVKGTNLVGFNGAGLWRAPSTALPEFANRTGVRQHSALDQYDRFAKAIRFNGNNVYTGNKNSVIYDTVIPQIHPVLKGGEIDNKNLMFSIENLAVGVIKGDSYGIIDDDFGSPIPLCEVGPFNGRIMWFPPYNLEIVENATAKKAETEKFITTFAKYYTPVMVFGALLLALVPPLIIPGATFSDWIYRALVVLVISCPCALVISIPLGYFGGIGRASAKGILIKGSNFLDALTKVKTVVFDKTGTLTKGEFKVTEVISANGFSTQEILECAAYAEFNSNHPVAKSISEAFNGTIDSARISRFEEISGFGIRAVIDGKIIFAGNDRLLHREEIEHPVCNVEGTVVHLTIDNVYAGYIIISDSLKDDSAETIERLNAKNIQTVMLTGDNKFAARAFAKKLKIDRFFSELLPADKVKYIEDLIEEDKGGKVVFVGDGINDAPVIARADVGIAMGALGSDAAIETADIVLMTDSPSKIVDAIDVAMKTRNIVWQNIIFALGVKLVFVILGIAGIATMWEAVFGDMGVALIAVFNSIRILKN